MVLSFSSSESQGLFSWRFSITLSYRYDITLVIGFFNVLNGTFIPGFSMLSGQFSLELLLLTFSVTHNDKWWLVRYLWIYFLWFWFSCTKIRPSSSRKETIKEAWAYGFQYDRNWSRLPNIRSKRFYEVKSLLFTNCQFMLLSTDIILWLWLWAFLFNSSKFDTYLCPKRGKGG